MRDGGILGILLALLALGVGFGLLERRFGPRPRRPWWKRPGTRTDVAWWMLAPLVTRTITRVVVVAGLVLAVLLAHGDVATLKAELAAGRLPDVSPLGLGARLRTWPFAVQLLVGLFVADLGGYASHRAFHGRRLWRFHAVHHSSERLDWLASVRVHPVNEILGRPIAALPLLLLGFEPAVFVLVAPFTTLYALLLHADVTWDFGPLRRVIASPAFHRWHHAADREARDRNFAGLFPVIDLAFGTFHLPKGRLPERLGVVGEPVPAGILAQLAWPFRRRRSPAGEPAAPVSGSPTA